MVEDSELANPNLEMVWWGSYCVSGWLSQFLSTSPVLEGTVEQWLFEHFGRGLLSTTLLNLIPHKPAHQSDNTPIQPLLLHPANSILTEHSEG
jgi:hypothetical protein